MLIDPKETEIDGDVFVLSKFPAILGREIVCGYPTSALPKVGDYKTNEDLMLKLMSRVGKKVGDEVIILSSRALIDNHIGSFETLMRLEWAMMEYNCSFFRNGALSGLAERAIPALSRMISQTLTDLSARSSAKGSPASTS